MLFVLTYYLSLGLLQRISDPYSSSLDGVCQSLLGLNLPSNLDWSHLRALWFQAASPHPWLAAGHSQALWCFLGTCISCAASAESPSIPEGHCQPALEWGCVAVICQRRSSHQSNGLILVTGSSSVGFLVGLCKCGCWRAWGRLCTLITLFNTCLLRLSGSGGTTLQQSHLCKAWDTERSQFVWGRWCGKLTEAFPPQSPEQNESWGQLLSSPVYFPEKSVFVMKEEELLPSFSEEGFLFPDKLSSKAG